MHDTKQSKKRTIISSNIKYDEIIIIVTWNKRHAKLQPSIKQTPINKRLFIEVIFTLRQNIRTVTLS